MKAHNTNRPPRTDQNTKENIWDGRGKLDNEGTDLPQGCGQRDLDHLTMIHRESDDLGVSSTIGRTSEQCHTLHKYFVSDFAFL